MARHAKIWARQQDVVREVLKKIVQIASRKHEEGRRLLFSRQELYKTAGPGLSSPNLVAILATLEALGLVEYAGFGPDQSGVRYVVKGEEALKRLQEACKRKEQ